MKREDYLLSFDESSLLNGICNRRPASHFGLTSCAVAASVFGRASSSVLAGAFLRAVLSESIRGAQLVAILAAVSGRADARAVDRRALRVVLAVAAILAARTVGVQGTRSAAGLAVPSLLAEALSGPGMAQFRIILLALASLQAVQLILIRFNRYYDFQFPRGNCNPPSNK